MFKFTHVFLLLELLVVSAQGDDPCCSDIENSQDDLKSDFKALQDLVHELRTSLELLQNVKPSTPPAVLQRKVAFFVGLNDHGGPFIRNTDIVFDSVVTNIGSAYSVSTGRFTAPVTAAYQFSFTIVAKHTMTAAAAMVKNGVTVLQVWSDSKPQWAPSSEEAILWLKAGDQVWLQVLNGLPSYFGQMRTTFSGFLIF